MKVKNIIIVLSIHIALFTFFIFMLNSTEIGVGVNSSELKQTERIVHDTLCVKEIKSNLPVHFDIVYESFKSYNPYTDSSSAISFANVVNAYGLSDIETLTWSLGQVLLESGGKQYYQPTHPKEGELVVSSAGAIGFTQIIPSTALGYMIKKVSDEDKNCFDELGATDYSFAYNDSYSNSKKLKMTREWLTNENNNMIMWGKIMSSKLKSKTIFDALISYNAGTNGLNKFLKAGNTQNQHKYIKGIKARLDYINLTY